MHSHTDSAWGGWGGGGYHWGGGGVGEPRTGIIYIYIYRILNMSPKKELLWGLGVGLRAERLQVDLKVSVLFLMTFYQYETKSICA